MVAGAVEDPAMKALILLQTHFSRISISGELVFDLNFVLLESIKLLQALVDVISSQGWLKPALAVMEVCPLLYENGSKLIYNQSIHTGLSNGGPRPVGQGSSAVASAAFQRRYRRYARTLLFVSHADYSSNVTYPSSQSD